MNFEEMTVVALRQFARENGIKLRAGIDKAGIIETITASLSGAELPPIPDQEPAEASVDAAAMDEKPAPAAEPEAKETVYRLWSNPNPPRTKPQPSARSPFQAQRPASPADTVMGRAPARPSSFTPRFGPAAGTVGMPQARREEFFSITPRGSVSRFSDDDIGADIENDSEPIVSPAPVAAPSVPAPLPDILQPMPTGDGKGILEVLPEGFGFLRDENMQSTEKDVYVSAAQIRRFGLRTGDVIEGRTRLQRDSDKFSALLYITSINSQPPVESSAGPVVASSAPEFDSLTAIYPNTLLKMPATDPVLQMFQLICPIGMGQRLLLIGPRSCGKSHLTRLMATAAAKSDRFAVQYLLLARRPEDITSITQSVNCTVTATSFDQSYETHQRTTENVIERVRKLAEQQKDVVLVVDNLNALFPQNSGRQDAPGHRNTLMHLLSIGRCIKEGGSVTLIASTTDDGLPGTVPVMNNLVDAANMVIYLNEPLSYKQFTPVVDMARSFVLHAEQYLDSNRLKAVNLMRNAFISMGPSAAMAQLYQLRSGARTQEDLLTALNDWLIHVNSKPAK